MLDSSVIEYDDCFKSHFASSSRKFSIYSLILIPDRFLKIWLSVETLQLNFLLKSFIVIRVL